jgi:hypothetical protein
MLTAGNAGYLELFNKRKYYGKWSKYEAYRIYSRISREIFIEMQNILNYSIKESLNFFFSKYDFYLNVEYLELLFTFNKRKSNKKLTKISH